MKTFQYFSLLIATLFCLSGCSEDGLDGANGNANVISKEITFNNTDFAQSQYVVPTIDGGMNGYNARKATITDPALTENLYNTGVVLVYLKKREIDGSYSWVPMPIRTTQYGNQNALTHTFKHQANRLDIYLYYEMVNNSGTVPNIHNTNIEPRTFKYIILTGQAASEALAGKTGWEEISE